MTMFSAEKRRFCSGEGYGFLSVGSDLVGGMTEEKGDSHVKEGGESSSKDEEWLQLSIGGGGAQDAGKKNRPPVELELLPHSQIRPETYRAPAGFSPSFISHQHEINWAFRPIPIASPSPSPSPSYFVRPAFQLYEPDFRVVQPPRRPHSGVWFMLQASHNQEREPFLPQISKSYLRIKDGRMTIRLVIKYLVNKLSLEDESEIEIKCKGQRLLPLLTLQYVRDNIWSSSRDFITLLPNSSTTHHIMVLHYARTHPSN
ncbi:protein LAX PANICLE 2-like [Salvia hispanica]|uniref:protein LAX PANICLE 2-like n=1 Tax=Salvia hispanica TaxID=49212 RepID=UPI002009C51E|nr:protein LAX PANICLE 2-like [Salvia hispanica]XP_047959456.1 protein LAX PANICLE 2-like [Salvia hispanica]